MSFCSVVNCFNKGNKKCHLTFLLAASTKPGSHWQRWSNATIRLKEHYLKNSPFSILELNNFRNTQTRPQPYRPQSNTSVPGQRIAKSWLVWDPGSSGENCACSRSVNDVQDSSTKRTTRTKIGWNGTRCRRCPQRLTWWGESPSPWPPRCACSGAHSLSGWSPARCGQSCSWGSAGARPCSTYCASQLGAEPCSGQSQEERYGNN